MDCIDDIRSHAKKATPTVLGTVIKVFLIRTITNATSSESPVMVAGGVDTNRGGRRPATCAFTKDHAKWSVLKWFEEISLDWIELDQDRPSDDSTQALEESLDYTPGWHECREDMLAFLVKWPTDRTTGPMADVIRLQLKQLILVEQRTRYTVKVRHSTHSRDVGDDSDMPSSLLFPNGLRTDEVYGTVEGPNKEAKSWVKFKIEGIIQGGALEEQLATATKSNEVYDITGKIRVRAVSRNPHNYSKVIAGVEEAKETVSLWSR
ncbi:hypothetical protein DPV78_000723 [Talaromyces pinophilus]|nr:hypothetical protein DPV78_000723 [Talaromyces pinophilus]